MFDIYAPWEDWSQLKLVLPPAQLWAGELMSQAIPELELCQISISEPFWVAQAVFLSQNRLLFFSIFQYATTFSKRIEGPVKVQQVIFPLPPPLYVPKWAPIVSITVHQNHTEEKQCENKFWEFWTHMENCQSNYLLLYLFLGTYTILVMTTMVVDNMQDKWMSKRGNGPGGYVTFLYIIMSTYILICFRYYNKWQVGMMNDRQRWWTTRGMGGPNNMQLRYLYLFFFSLITITFK